MNLYRDDCYWAKVPGIRFAIHWPLFLVMLVVIAVLSATAPTQGITLGVAYFIGLASRYFSGD